jgi:hypothetical protein
VWLLGFPRVADPTAPHGFAVAATVPTRRQFNRVLRTLSNDALQFLLTRSISAIHDALTPAQQAQFAQVVAGDTAPILAWVKENNPKLHHVTGRFDKTHRPTGDPDCRLGVKQRTNTPPAETTPPTPTTDPAPARACAIGTDILWGYASGVIATILPDHLGEVVLAERTRPFNESDISYFFPLMTQTEQRLGVRPPSGVFDAAFDAFYVYEYFHQAGGAAIVPLVAKAGAGATATRQFAADGRPLCAAGLPMSLQFTYQDRTSGLVPHERGKYRCPLAHPTVTTTPCPIHDDHRDTGGCATTVATSIGARIRHQLDRESDWFKQLYKQRTVTERINSQAEALGIQAPKLRNGCSITNQNTLIYVLINLRALQRLRERQAVLARAEVVQALTA